MSFRVEGLLASDELSDAPRAPHPTDVDVMVATPGRSIFIDPGWIFERKLAGIRCIAHRDGDDIRLWSGGHRDLCEHFPAIVDALAAQVADDFVIDGEIVTTRQGPDHPAWWQERCEPGHYSVYDVVHSDGRDLRNLPLRRRKAVLRDLLSYTDPVRPTPHRNADGVAAFDQAIRNGWDGVIAKDAASAYVAGPSTAWLDLDG